MLYIFRAVLYCTIFLWNQLLHNFICIISWHVSVAIIRPSSGRMFFLNKAAYGTLVEIIQIKLCSSWFHKWIFTEEFFEKTWAETVFSCLS
jgi:hypothetical protein